MSHFPKQIIICRHGEKPKDTHFFGLSQKGLARSAYLIEYFADPIKINKIEMYNKPDKIYCFSTHDGINRSKQLMQPLIDAHNIPVNTEYNNHKHGTTQLVDELFTPDNDNLTILICWEHNIIPELIQQIGEKIDNADFNKIKYWSSNPEKIHTDDDAYSLTFVIEPSAKSLIIVNQSDDFSKDDSKLKKLDKYKVLFTL